MSAEVAATVLGMTLQALIAELCKPTLAPRTTEA